MPARLLRKERHANFGLPFARLILRIKRVFRVSFRTVLYRLGQRHDRLSEADAKRLGVEVVEPTRPNREPERFPFRTPCI